MINFRYKSNELSEFQDLDVNDAFIKNDDVYIKTDEINDTEQHITWNAYCLTSNTNHAHIASHQYVRAVDLDILVKD